MRAVIDFSPTDHPGPPDPGEVALPECLAAALEAAGMEAASPPLGVPGGESATGAGPGLDPEAAAARLRTQFADALPHLWVSIARPTDHLERFGPRVCAALDIPYVVLEPWFVAAEGGESPTGDEHREVLARADGVITFSAERFEMLEQWLPDPTRLTRLLPWVDATPFFEAARLRDQYRASIASRLQLPREAHWLLADGPMEAGGAVDSFRLLARALSRLPMLEWTLVVAGDGPASGEVDAMLRPLPANRVRRWPEARPGDRPALYAACDLFLWPAIGEVGVDAVLEAQAAGLPVVACASPGVHERVRDGVTGRVVAAGNAEAYANVIGFLLRHPQFLSSYREGARRTVVEDHDLWVVGRALAGVLEQAVARYATASR